MNTPIMLTPNDLITIFLGACGFVITVGGAVALIAKAVTSLRTPNKLQNERLDKHEEWLKKHDVMLDNDNKRLKLLEDGNRITQRALLELLKHGIDGNDVDGMRRVRDDLQQYLIDR